MNDLRHRVAQVIFSAGHPNPEREDFDKLGPEFQDVYLEKADAAIEEVRNPLLENEHFRKEFQMAEAQELDGMKKVVIAAYRFREHDTLRARDELFAALDALDAIMDAKSTDSPRPF